jgi:hypothetical protein
VSNARDKLGSTINRPRSLIQYFHRTAREFLEKDEHWSRLLRQTKADFNPNFAMMRSCLVEVKFETSARAQKDFMIYSYHAESHTESHSAQVALLDQFNEIVIAGDHEAILDLIPNFTGIADFQKLAAEYGLRAYVTAKITQQDKSQQEKSATILLRYLLKEKDFLILSRPPLPRLEMVSLLLDLGADPNRSDGTRTLWEGFLDMLINQRNPDGVARSAKLRYMQIMEILAYSGADLQASAIDYPGLNAIDFVEKILMLEYPLEAISLLRAFQDTMSPLILGGNRKRPRDEIDDDCTESLRLEKRAHHSFSFEMQ